MFYVVEETTQLHQKSFYFCFIRLKLRTYQTFRNTHRIIEKRPERELRRCDVSFDAEGNASGTVGYQASANQFLMQYHPHQKARPSPQDHASSIPQTREEERHRNIKTHQRSPNTLYGAHHCKSRWQQKHLEREFMQIESERAS